MMKLAKPVYNALREEAIQGEHENKVICGVLLGTTEYVNVGIKLIRRAKCEGFIKYDELVTDKYIKRYGCVREWIFFGKAYPVVMPDPKIIEKKEGVIGMYVFYPRSIKRIERKVKQKYRWRSKSFQFLVMLHLDHSQIILKTEKSLSGFKKFFNPLLKRRQLDTLMSQIGSMHLEMVGFKKKRYIISRMGIEIMF
ncbi:MAG: hypothetical protein KAQ92_07005 [Candidatus Aenigmarchaeota archaeon]|nr:hypothetical protein [Candidatus Aenigmarchaeota archaeon]